MTTTKTKRKTKRKTKAQKDKQRLQAKAQSPGVPPNTCPYIDMTLTMIDDLAEAYDKMYTKGEHSPTAEKIAEQAKDMLELIRTTNETLRDNSAYWYNRYKDTFNTKIW